MKNLFLFFCLLNTNNTLQGLGHATRAVLIIKTLLEQGHDVALNTLVPRLFIFQSLLQEFYPQNELKKGNLSIRQSPLLDPGVAQLDAFSMDSLKSFQNLNQFLSRVLEEHIRQESDWLLQEKVDLVCLDAPFGPAKAAKVN